MTQTDRLRALFDAHGGRITLRDIMDAYLAASYRQRMTDLKRELIEEGKTITCHQVRDEGHKSETYWEIVSIHNPNYYTEPTGQRGLVLK